MSFFWHKMMLKWDFFVLMMLKWDFLALTIIQWDFWLWQSSNKFKVVKELLRVILLLYLTWMEKILQDLYEVWTQQNKNFLALLHWADNLNLTHAWTTRQADIFGQLNFCEANNFSLYFRLPIILLPYSSLSELTPNVVDTWLHRSIKTVLTSWTYQLFVVLTMLR